MRYVPHGAYCDEASYVVVVVAAVVVVSLDFLFVKASMAADTIRDFLETGTIVNSVNFPSTFLPDAPKNSVRFTVVNKNVAGMLAHITEAFAEANLNILQQINQSKGEIAYNVMDVDTSGRDDVLSFKQVQEKITMLDGVLSSRVLYGTPGTGYARNLDGQYFV